MTTTWTNATKHTSTFANTVRGFFGFLLKLDGFYLLKLDGGKIMLTAGTPSWSNLTKH